MNKSDVLILYTEYRNTEKHISIHYYTQIQEVECDFRMSIGFDDQ